MKMPHRFYLIAFSLSAATITLLKYRDMHKEPPLTKDIGPRIMGFYSSFRPTQDWRHKNEDLNAKQYDEIRIGVVCCNDRLEETLTMLKSAILFSSSPLRIFVFTDEHLAPHVDNQLKKWRAAVTNTFSYEMWPVSLPATQNAEWRQLFRPCASQRLFISNLLKDIDSIIYLDCDTVFVGPLEDAWHQFSLMNASQVVGMTPESNEDIRHPIYGTEGLNSGVFLMNLTRMRASSWEDLIIPTFSKYKDVLTLGDQDILNIILHFHPDKVLVMPCRLNYRIDHCEHGCEGVNVHGPAIIHGNRKTFHESGKRQGFRAIYTAIRDYELGTDPYLNLLAPMSKNFEKTKNSTCGIHRELLMKAMKSHFKKPDFIISIPS